MNDWRFHPASCLFVTSFTFIRPPTQPFAHTFAYLLLRITYSLSQSVSRWCIHLFTCFFSLLCSSVFVTKLSGLRATYVTFESVRIEWNPVPELFILGYKVLVQNTSFSQFVPWNVYSTLMKGLHSNSSYVIKVFPVHGLAVEGILPDSSQSIIVNTDEDRGKT